MQAGARSSKTVVGESEPVCHSYLAFAWQCIWILVDKLKLQMKKLQ